MSSGIYSNTTVNLSDRVILNAVSNDNLDFEGNGGANVSLTGLETIELNGSISGAITQQANASTTNYTITWPSAQSSGTQVLSNDGTGALSWVIGGSGTSSDTEVLYNNAGTTDGISNITTNGSTQLNFSDSAFARFGADADFTITHGGTNTNITSNTGNLVIDNTNSSGRTIMILGDDTDATSCEIQNNSTSAVITGYGDRNSTFHGDTTTLGSQSGFTTVTTLTTAGNEIYTASQLRGGLVLRDPSGGNRSDDLPTAANFVSSVHDAAIGSSYEFTIENTADASESITITGTDPGVTLDPDSSFGIAENQSRTFKVVFTNVTAASEAVTVYSISAGGVISGGGGGGTPGGINSEIQYNNAGSFGGITGITTNGSTQLNFSDSASAVFGTGSDLTISHAGFSSITNSTGNLLIENTVTTGAIFLKLGGTTPTPVVQVRDSSDTPLFSVTGDGDVSVNQDNASFKVGADADLQLTHDGTDSEMTSFTGDLIIDNRNTTGNTIARLGTDDANTNFRVQNNSANNIVNVTGRGGFEYNQIIVYEQLPSSSNGGTFNAGAWRNRPLNTLHYLRNSPSWIVFNGGLNRFNITPGTYYVEASAPAFQVDRHQTRLRDNTGTATLVVGSNETADSGAVQTRSFLKGVFTLGASSLVQLQHRCETTQANSGFGRGSFWPNDVEVEIFAMCRIVKLS